MKYYFLGLATVVAVCVGCASDGSQWARRNGDQSSIGVIPVASKGNSVPVTLVGDNLQGVPPQGVIHTNYHSEHRHRKYIAPPAHQLMHPGPMVDLAAPGIMQIGYGAPPPAGPALAVRTSQLRFVGPEGMQIGWQIGPSFADNQLTAPNVYNFRQGAVYRLKLAAIPDRPGVVLYPTLQVYPSHPQTDAYLAHNSIPLLIKDEDLEQVQSNNFVTKVIFLPSPRNQELAVAGVEELVSTRLEPGMDPVAEADRRGTILAVLRIGNMNMETAPTQGPAPLGAAGAAGGITQASYNKDGDKNEHVAPVPIETAYSRGPGIPPAQIMGVTDGPARPAFNPVTGAPGAPTFGSPYSSTPIGLVGGPTLPMGGRSSLRSYTIRDRTKRDLPRQSEHFLVDVERRPGYSLPKTVDHVRIIEKHPIVDTPELPPNRYDYKIKENLRVGNQQGQLQNGFAPADGTPAYCPPGSEIGN